MQKLKIGMVLDDSLDPSDGVQQYVLAVGKWLRSEGHDVHYLVGITDRTSPTNIHSLSRNIRVKFNKNRLSIPITSSMKSIKSLLNAENFDVLHVQMPYSPLFAAKVIKAASAKTAVIGTFHVAPSSKFVILANKTLALFLRQSLKRFDNVMSVSKTAAELASSSYGINSVIIPNTIDLTPFYNSEPFSNLDDSKNIVFLGRLVERKGCQYLLNAVNYMKNNIDIKVIGKWHVIICGGGPLEASLKQYVSSKGLAENVEFTGRISESDKPRYLASADIAVYPSTGGESFGIVLIEGMAAARGVVLAGDNPGYATVLGSHPEVMFDPQDEKSFGLMLSNFLKNDKARQIAHIWQQSESKQYDVPAVGKQILEVYQSALRKRSI